MIDTLILEGKHLPCITITECFICLVVGTKNSPTLVPLLAVLPVFPPWALPNLGVQRPVFQQWVTAWKNKRQDHLSYWDSLIVSSACQWFSKDVIQHFPYGMCFQPNYEREFLTVKSCNRNKQLATKNANAPPGPKVKSLYKWQLVFAIKVAKNGQFSKKRGAEHDITPAGQVGCFPNGRFMLA